MFWREIARYLGARDQLQLRLVCKDAAYTVAVEQRSRLFAVQAPALAEAVRARKELGVEGLRVWATDCLPRSPKKRFLVATADTIHMLLLVSPPMERCFYELLLVEEDLAIHDEADMPMLCATRGYLDCEFMREFNPDMPPDSEVEQMIVQEFTRREAIACNVPETNVIAHVAKAHNDAKFSIHVVFVALDETGTEVLFASPMHVGAMVRTWEHEQRDTDDFQRFVVNDHTDKTACIVDNGVYTKHRMFRTWLSSKKGQFRFLVSTSGRPVGSPQAWKDFLLQDVRRGPVRIVRLTEADGREPLSSSGWLKQQHAKVPIKRAINSSSSGRPFKRARTDCKTIVHLLEEWVQFETGDPTASAKFTATFTPASRQLVIGTSQAKTCNIYNGAHNGNHIYFVFDSETLSVRQKCHSSRCAGRYHAMEPPEEVMDQLRIAKQLCNLVN